MALSRIPTYFSFIAGDFNAKVGKKHAYRNTTYFYKRYDGSNPARPLFKSK